MSLDASLGDVGAARARRMLGARPKEALGTGDHGTPPGSVKVRRRASSSRIRRAISISRSRSAVSRAVVRPIANSSDNNIVVSPSRFFLGDSMLFSKVGTPHR